MTPRLRSVPKQEEEVREPMPSFDYEWQERRRIAAKRWDRVHIAGDRGAVISWGAATHRRWWR